MQAIITNLLLALQMAVTTQQSAGQPSIVDLVRQKRYLEARKSMQGLAEPAELRDKIVFHRLRAAIASGLNEHSAAANEMETALTLAPDDSGLLLATAVAELQAERFDKALANALRVESAAGQATVGDIQEQRHEYVAAARAYQRAVELEPNSEAYRMALALELVQHATFTPAITVLEQAVPLFPHSAKLRTLLGVAYYAVGEMEKATSALLDAIAADHSSLPAYRYLAKLALEGSNEPDATLTEVLCGWDKTVCAVFRLRSNPQDESSADILRGAQGALARCELARAYEHSDRWAEARTQLESCTRLDDTPQNHYRLGRVYERLGLTQKARREMTLYRAGAAQQSQENARRQEAVRAFQVVVR